MQENVTSICYHSFFNTAWGKLLREVADSSSHEVTEPSAFCQNGVSQVAGAGEKDLLHNRAMEPELLTSHAAYKSYVAL